MEEALSQDTKCECGCHERHEVAAVRGHYERKLGKIYYYHEDCDCCADAIQSPFAGLLSA